MEVESDEHYETEDESCDEFEEAFEEEVYETLGNFTSSDGENFINTTQYNKLSEERETHAEPNEKYAGNTEVGVNFSTEYIARLTSVRSTFISYAVIEEEEKVVLSEIVENRLPSISQDQPYASYISVRK